MSCDLAEIIYQIVIVSADSLGFFMYRIIPSVNTVLLPLFQHGAFYFPSACPARRAVVRPPPLVVELGDV